MVTFVTTVAIIRQTKSDCQPSEALHEMQWIKQKYLNEILMREGALYQWASYIIDKSLSQREQIPLNGAVLCA